MALYVSAVNIARTIRGVGPIIRDKLEIARELLS